MGYLLSLKDPADLFTSGTKAQVDAEIRVFDTFGGWDAVSPIAASDAWELVGLRSKFSGGESGDLQILETENMQIEDYDLVSEIGWSPFINDHLVPRISDTEDGEVWGKKAIDIFGVLIQSVADVKGRGATLRDTSKSALNGSITRDFLQRTCPEISNRKTQITDNIQTTNPNSLTFQCITACSAL